MNSQLLESKSRSEGGASARGTVVMRKKAERILVFRKGADARKGVGSLLNLGPKSSAWLVKVGITSVAEVRRLGPIEVCRRVRAAGCPVSVMFAYALEGGLTGCHWNAIPAEAKAYLRTEFAKLRRAEG